MDTIEEMESYELVKYGNQLNDLKFPGFGSLEYDFFMLALAKTKNRGQELIEIDYEDVKEAIGYQGYKKQFLSYIMPACEKVLRLKLEYVVYDEGNVEDYVGMNFFCTFKWIGDRDVLQIRVNIDAIPLLNAITDRFTAFALKEYTSLISKYSKRLYMLLKQWRTLGHCPTKSKDKYFTITQIREIFNIPEKYTARDIKREVLSPAVAEINDKGYFKNLELLTHTEKKRGNPCIGYSFSFAAQKDSKSKKYEELPPEQQRAIDYKKEGTYKSKKNEEKKKNRFNDFPQREYTEKEINEMEKSLLSR